MDTYEIKYTDVDNISDITFKHIFALTRYFLEKKRDGEIRDFDHLVRLVKVNNPRIWNMAYTFDETIWPPVDKYKYNDLVEFRVQLRNQMSHMPFRLFLSKGQNQSPILTHNFIWEEH